jgi:histidinol-phosphate aminotransferase
LTQQVALRELQDLSAIEKGISEILNGRQWLESKLPACEIVHEVFPSDSNFLLVRVDEADLRYRQLIENGLVVRNRSREPLCEQCLRITVGTREENEKLIATLKSFELNRRQQEDQQNEKSTIHRSRRNDDS